ncbi:DegV family protein [Chloroflexota bacterium]
MAKVKIIADSSVCLPKKLIEEYGIHLVPEVIIFGETVYRDGVNLNSRDFYTRLEQVKDLPTTSAPSPQDFYDTYQKASEGADGLACILVTAGFSQMGMEAAQKARKTFSGIPLEIIDSRTAVGAYGLVVLAAARAATMGKSLPEVVKATEDIKRRVNFIFTLDTLKYVAKGGRIGKVAFWAGSLLSLKPILEVPTTTGVLEPVERVRTRQKALKRLLEIMGERIGAGKPVHVNIVHANVPNEANWLKGQVSSRFDCSEIYIADFAPVVGVHCGPGVIGLSFYTDN